VKDPARRRQIKIGPDCSGPIVRTRLENSPYFFFGAAFFLAGAFFFVAFFID
jgi:hypothetical protein